MKIVHKIYCEIIDENLLRINDEDYPEDLFCIETSFSPSINEKKCPRDLLKMNEEDYPEDLL